MFGSWNKLPRNSKPGPRNTSCWCSIHHHRFFPGCVCCVRGPGVPAAKFTVDHEGMNLSSASINANFDGLYNFNLFRCSLTHKILPCDP